MKKNEGNCFSSTSPVNLLNSLKNNFENISSYFDNNSKDLTVESSLNHSKHNQYHMLEYKLKQIKQQDNSVLGSVPASPSFFSNTIYHGGFDHQSGNFEFFDNMSKSPVRNSGSNTPRLLIEDYLNTSNSPAAIYENKIEESLGPSSKDLS